MIRVCHKGLFAINRQSADYKLMHVSFPFSLAIVNSGYRHDINGNSLITIHSSRLKLIQWLWNTLQPSICMLFPNIPIWIYKSFRRLFLVMAMVTRNVTGGFPSQRASNADNFSIWWRHHEGFSVWIILYVVHLTCTVLLALYISLQVYISYCIKTSAIKYSYSLSKRSHDVINIIRLRTQSC